MLFSWFYGITVKATLCQEFGLPSRCCPVYLCCAKERGRHARGEGSGCSAVQLLSACPRAAGSAWTIGVVLDYSTFAVWVLLVALAAGLVLLYFGGNWLTDGAAALALKLRIEPVVIGLTVVSVCTSAPELVTSFVSGAAGNSGLAVGNILGSNLANLGLILGIAALIHPFTVKERLIRAEVPILVGVTVVFYLFAIGGFNRIEGALLLLMTGAYLVYVVKASRRVRAPFVAEVEDELSGARLSAVLAVVLLLGGTLALTVGAELLAGGGAELAHRLGVSDFIIGITIVAVGTSLPELAACIVAALKRQMDLVAGNLIGSNLFNMMLIGGSVPLFFPLAVDPAWLALEFPAMLVLTLVMWRFIWTGCHVHRWEAVILLALYIGIILASTLR